MWSKQSAHTLTLLRVRTRERREGNVSSVLTDDSAVIIDTMQLTHSISSLPKPIRGSPAIRHCLHPQDVDRARMHV